MIFIFYKINIGKSLDEILPILAIYLVAGYKLIPAIQGIATAYASIKGNQTAMDSTLEGLSNLDPNYFIDRKIDKLEFKKLNLLNISFSYGSKEILENIDLEIKKEQFTGIIGKTGVGKSTLIHIVSGLLKPTKGEIKIDGKNLLKKRRN